MEIVEVDSVDPQEDAADFGDLSWLLVQRRLNLQQRKRNPAPATVGPEDASKPLFVLLVCLFARSKPKHTQMMTFDATCIV